MANDQTGWYRKLFPTAHRKLLNRTLKRHLSSLSGEVLVIGAGYEPYRQILKNADKVCLTDISDEYGEIDCIADAHDLPFSDESFDGVVAVEVFEHLQKPATAALEVFRVLRPGGRAIISIPFMYHVHGDPSDYSRFTRFGLNELFAKFGIVNIEEFGTRLSVMSDIITTTHPAFAALRFLNHIVASKIVSGRSSSDCPSGYCIELVKN